MWPLAGGGCRDQLTATLGIWQHGVIPRINTIDALADDVATRASALRCRNVMDLIATTR
ncbi:MAG: hypothetical protein CM15mP74_06890 [Halieaceae bacterium]|nr:MAG: hypothetical protein CM15mP74_06890 [Halieaceae bacterium]